MAKLTVDQIRQLEQMRWGTNDKPGVECLVRVPIIDLLPGPFPGVGLGDVYRALEERGRLLLVIMMGLQHGNWSFEKNEDMGQSRVVFKWTIAQAMNLKGWFPNAFKRAEYDTDFEAAIA